MIGMERLWELGFYLASAPRSVTIPELLELVDYKWHKRTLIRDMAFWVKFSVVETYLDSHGLQRFKWIGNKKPFLKVKQFYCRACNQFKELFDMMPTDDNRGVRSCKQCNRDNRNKYYERNHEYERKKQNSYRAKGGNNGPPLQRQNGGGDQGIGIGRDVQSKEGQESQST
jgi:hypothetical protein